MEVKKRNFTTVLLFLVVIFVFAFLFLAKNRIEKKEICLSEICIHNDGVIHNSAGYYDDYVELYNGGDVEVELKGYYLSDDKNNLYKYDLQYITIQAKSYEIVFLNDTTTGFNLSEEETLYLTDSKGVLCDSIDIPVVGSNESYCFDFENKQWEISSIPTPKEPNTFESKYKKTINAPVANYQSGYYEDDFFVQITGSGTIYYTLDGSVPTEESNKYEEPIHIYNRSTEENTMGSQEEVTTASWQFFNENPTKKSNRLKSDIV